MHWKLRNDQKHGKTWKMKNSKIDQENEELGGQDHDLDLFWVLSGCSHFLFD